MSVSYRVVVRDQLGGNERPITGVISIDAARAINTVGSATIVVADDHYAPNFWIRDMRFEIWRVADNGFPYLLGNTIWFARKFTWLYDQKRWQIECVDANDILARRLVAYTGETIYAEKTEEWGNNGPADNLMKAYVRENLGSDVENSFRDLSDLIGVEADRYRGETTQKEASFQELFSTLTSLADDSRQLGTALYFNMEPQQDGTFIFKVTRNAMGMDRTQGNAPLLFGPSFKNLTEISVEWDYSEEKTVIYAGGDGEGAGKLWVAVKDDNRVRASPFNRIEGYIDVRDQDDENLLNAEARAELAKRRPRLRLSGLTVDTPDQMFGRDYFYGDKVAAVVDNFRFDCLIDAFSISYSEGREGDLSIRLNGEIAL